MTKKSRIDSLLVVQNFFSSVGEAKKAIILGHVLVNEQKVLKTTEMYSLDAVIRVEVTDKYVSRGAYKLLSCLDAKNLRHQFVDKIVYDIGSSTGGFTQVALECGAKKVIAIDVGTNQLDYSLRNNKHVVAVEKTNILNLDMTQYEDPDIIVVDISFQSIKRIAEKILIIAQPKKALVIALVKPQFELPRSLIPDGGVVTDKKHVEFAVSECKLFLKNLSIQNIDEFYCPVLGRQGNQEVFIIFKIERQY